VLRKVTNVSEGLAASILKVQMKIDRSYSRVNSLCFQGFSFPPEAGYPLDPDLGPRYFMMETHYNNPAQDTDITDSSGIRVFYTASLRRHDAGVLSVGLDPNWRHIIPPGQREVVSEGHCISACTKLAVPPRGIKIFAVMLHTHLIGMLKHFAFFQQEV